MDEELTWGIVCTVWIVAVSIPYLYATSLTIEGKSEASDRISNRILGPWTIGFVGLMVAWALKAPAGFAIIYSGVAVFAIALWAVWSGKRKKPKAANLISSGNVDVKLDRQMLFSKVQRLILIVIAAIIAIMLFIQIEEEGLRDSPWIVGLVVIAALLMLAFASSGKDVSRRR